MQLAEGSLQLSVHCTLNRQEIGEKMFILDLVDTIRSKIQGIIFEDKVIYKLSKFASKEKILQAYHDEHMLCLKHVIVTSRHTSTFGADQKYRAELTHCYYLFSRH